MTRLHGKLVGLRALERKDREELRAFVNDPEVMRLSSVYVPVSDVQQDEWFESAFHDHRAVWFGIEDIRTDPPRLIGTCCLVDIDWVGRSGELRIRLGVKEAWGGGLGTDACRLLIDFAFNDLNLQRLGLRVWDSNTRAQRLYARLGFVMEGRLRRAGFVHGRVNDLVVMGLLREEWPAS
jgi:RimJ/RimL family protein N-acetyltransferase